MSVAKYPGEIVFTWMSYRARSAAMPLVSCATAPLVAEYGAIVSRASADWTEPMLTILPEPRRIIAGTRCRVT